MNFVRALTNFCGLLALVVLALPLAGRTGQVPAELQWMALALGHVGACVLSTVVLGVCLLRGALAWIPGSGARRWAFGLALHAALGVVSIALLPRALPAPAQLLTASSLLGCETLYLLTLVNFAPATVGFSEI